MSETTTTLRRERMGSYIQWSINLTEMGDKTPEMIMMENGYHPAGYGQPYDIRSTEDTMHFRCWASCD